MTLRNYAFPFPLPLLAPYFSLLASSPFTLRPLSLIRLSPATVYCHLLYSLAKRAGANLSPELVKMSCYGHRANISMPRVKKSLVQSARIA